MKKIQMVDLKGQYENIKETVNNSIQEVLDTNTYINGPEVHKFQKNLEEYLGAKHVIPCANGTDALQIAMMALDLKPGDEVITADFTFAATVEVIALLQLTPVLVDVEIDTFNISVEAIKKAITPKTKAIVPVHLFGQAANMEAIMQLAKEHNLYVIEDNAQAIGANYKYFDGKKEKVGVIGHVASTSFFPSKNLGCYGDGGAIFTNDDDLAHKLRGIVNHGMYVRYHHDVVGVNSRLDSIQAAVLNAKLPLLDEYNAARQLAAQKYSQALANHDKIVTPYIAGERDSHVFHQYTLRILDADRNALMQHLLDKGIPCAIYYPIPLHSQKAYLDPRYKEEDFPITNQLVQEVISLPMHTELDDEQIKFITDSILEFLA
ncbi:MULTISPECIES: DegT/DnrJ/EryC1/StrS aminotransferase family protein [Flavobacterium]|jgi:UDP-2-acetamido-2-deoxy-ribo-hexuluronate aminotransferase|uniref:DegT/DnrJ/EryC1/StrS family aminotransferase n=1 Tax=Flavobacterium TaxID=237 RepID=UPI0006F5022B|nr:MULTISPECIES: DegT/DnrJ/EryC1/StrS family aminotransferase [Flavobacterium]MBU7571181.1 DegT/DnrJ/EryC1/StrS family aminotransferase [Flavobacterium sp.]PZO28018.1 MAG: DegT/DnrJ/EryC1/StrS family aminotransferase [Flavobacteriaceae bacterium]PZQ91017.1 MAG: DegT/DnrJ/EryC1/StrS family aminotransferase [Flavobacterium johnsoniae]KQS50259.1 transcriptional regulator [Flavobacterium sp. Leaf359]MBL7867025.1 DegT/DnrJ/EryC1/StrS family aminotransferase [Flavobacterium lindanitolerans]